MIYMYTQNITKSYTSILAIYMEQKKHCYGMLTTYGHHPNEMLKLCSDLRRCFNKTLVMAMTLPGKKTSETDPWKSSIIINATISNIN